MSDNRLPVDPVSSFAHREGAIVRVQLHLPTADLPDGELQVRLKRAGKRRSEQGELVHADDGAMLRFSVGPEARGRLPWNLAVRTGVDDGVQPVQARLLMRAGQPVALLPGPRPTTRLAPPRRRQPAEASPVRKVARRGRSLARRVKDTVSSRR